MFINVFLLWYYSDKFKKNQQVFSFIEQGQIDINPNEQKKLPVSTNSFTELLLLLLSL